MKRINKAGCGADTLLARKQQPEGPRASADDRTILDLISEALKWSSELDGNLTGIHDKLFGSAPECGNWLLVQEHAEAKLVTLSSRLASMCGFTSTMLQRIGGE